MTDAELIELVRQMRAAQSLFFQNRADRDALNRARELERKVDAAIIARKQGSLF